ncbi:hypothetical protein [Stenotrophomonas maltophilia]|uniref:AbiU2 domain-containing protein n=1 Tax=Stenotrophomonas maltophilia TaxID=40324 RepID=UPI0022F3F269|nr:hypothetical protein [Stenotrophomonas maltophilia]MDA5342853.1 hypothetical protein [Stenotrophomonas maltophilia]
MEESKVVVVYGLVASRLTETRQVYTISKAIHDTFGDRILTDQFSHTASVAGPILWSCQFATFVGLVSILEKKDGSASIPALARLVRASGAEVSEEIEAEAAAICEKYRIFRNKLFSHNSTQRERHREIFNEAKITWDQLDADFDAVERILFQIADKHHDLSIDLIPFLMRKDVSSTESMMKKLLSRIQEKLTL